MTKWRVCWPVGLGILLAGTTRAAADQIPWSFSWSASPQVTRASGSAPGFVVLPGAGSGSRAGSATLQAHVWGLSSASANSPDTIQDVPYTLKLRIMDNRSGAQGVVKFSGLLSGTLSSRRDNLSFTLTSPSLEKLHLGHTLFFVSYQGFVSPGEHGRWSAGSFRFDVGVRHNPEPSSLLLAALAVPGFAVPAWRRRLREKQAGAPV